MPETLNVVLLILAGGIAGFLSGIFRMGGWVILVPILVFLYKSIGVSSLVSTHLAFGTSFMAVGIASTLAAYRDAKSGYVVWKVVAIAGGIGMLGAVVGSSIAAGLVDQMLRKGFAVVTGITAIVFFAEGKRAKGEENPNMFPPALASAGFLAGFVSSLAGVAVDALLVPMMYKFFRFPLKKAIGSSGVVIALGLLAASIAYMVKGSGNVLLPDRVVGYVDVVHAIPIIAAIVPANLSAARLSERITSSKPRKSYGTMLIIIAVLMFFS